jgi:WD repeat and SOF domain-containing protein 1
MVSVGDDKLINIWRPLSEDGSDPTVPRLTLTSKSFLLSVDHHRTEQMFATSGSQVDLWNHERAEPVASFSWGADSISTVRFNQTETSVFAACGMDRSVILYDCRMTSPLSKMIMTMRGNALAWNPMEAFNFTVANEDHNLYTFDMRRMDRALNVLKDHVSAVLDVDYSPTGHEIVTGSYDRSIRIFRSNEGRSREIYHTNRMQRIFCVRYSMDAEYVFSGSDDGNIRLWKAEAAAKLGPISTREKNSLEYSQSLKKRFGHMPEIRRISRQRHVPKDIKVAQRTKREILDAEKRRMDNRVRHQAEGTVKFSSVRKKAVLTVEK